MSVQSLSEFMDKLVEDESLQKEMDSVTANKEDMPASQAIADLGIKHGYNFTAEEALQLRQAILERESGELSEAQLEAVAGGGPTGAKVGAIVGHYAEEVFNTVKKFW